MTKEKLIKKFYEWFIHEYEWTSKYQYSEYSIVIIK